MPTKNQIAAMDKLKTLPNFAPDHWASFP